VLFVAGLFVATFERLSHQPTGFSSERLLVVDTVARRPQPPALWDQVAEHLRAMPGIESVALAAWPLFGGNGANGFVTIDGAPAGDTLAYFLAISPGWMETMKIPFVDGRDIRAGDTFPVAIVNEAFAKSYFNGRDPVGQWFERPQAEGRARIQIVGLVRDARYRNMREPITPTAYVPFSQVDGQGAWVPQASGTFVVRTAGANPLALASILRREIPRARPEFRAGNIRAHYSRWLLYAIVGLLLLANTINLGADLGAMAAALKLLVGGPAALYIAGFAIGCTATPSKRAAG